MNYKLLFEIELEKTKDLDKKLIIRNVEISNLKYDIKKLKRLLEEQNKKIIELESTEPEIKYVYKDSIVYA